MAVLYTIRAISTGHKYLHTTLCNEIAPCYRVSKLECPVQISSKGNNSVYCRIVQVERIDK